MSDGWMVGVYVIDQTENETVRNFYVVNEKEPKAAEQLAEDEAKSRFTIAPKPGDENNELVQTVGCIQAATLTAMGVPARRAIFFGYSGPARFI